MDETPTPRPSPDHPVWGPPRAPRVADRPAPRRIPSPPQSRRRHPAARARRIAGWAAVASSAALVGYMVTANAQTKTSNNSTATPTVVPTSPTTPATVPATNSNGDDDTPATVPATSTPVQLPVPARTQPSRPLPVFNGGGRPNSSTHGS